MSRTNDWKSELYYERDEDDRKPVLTPWQWSLICVVLSVGILFLFEWMVKGK